MGVALSNGIAGVLLLANAKDQFRVTFDSVDEMSFWSMRLMTACAASSSQKEDCTATICPRSWKFVNAAADNESECSQQACSRAVAARTLHRCLGRLSIGRFIPVCGRQEGAEELPCDWR